MEAHDALSARFRIPHRPQTYPTSTGSGLTLRIGRGGALTDDLWDFPAVTVAWVNSETERNLRVLADRIEADAQLFLHSLKAHMASRPHAWVVEGVTVDTTMLLCHLLNEMVVHGYDITRADGRPWPIPRAHAVESKDVVYGVSWPE